MPQPATAPTKTPTKTPSPSIVPGPEPEIYPDTICPFLNVGGTQA